MASSQRGAIIEVYIPRLRREETVVVACTQDIAEKAGGLTLINDCEGRWTGGGYECREPIYILSVICTPDNWAVVADAVKSLIIGLLRAGEQEVLSIVFDEGGPTVVSNRQADLANAA